MAGRCRAAVQQRETGYEAQQVFHQRIDIDFMKSKMPVQHHFAFNAAREFFSQHVAACMQQLREVR